MLANRGIGNLKIARVHYTGRIEKAMLANRGIGNLKTVRIHYTGRTEKVIRSHDRLG